MKKNILIFHPALAPYRVDFFNALNHAFNAHFYFNLENVSDQKFDQDELKKKCDFTCNYLDKGFEFGGRSFRMGAISAIKKHKPNIILCSEYSPLTCFIVLYVKSLRKDIKIYTLSDDSIKNSVERTGIRAKLRNIISKNIDGVLFTSKEVCDWYNANISEKTKTLELPIIHKDSEMRKRLQDSLPEANEIIEKYNLEGKKIILFVGRLVEVKNLEFLINSISKLTDKTYKLVIVGDGVLRGELEDLTKKLNLSEQIIFTGRKEGKDLDCWYTFSNIFVLPSTYERYGAVVNESLLGGCFTLCSETAGASSLINNQNGDLFSPESEVELTEKLAQALKDTNPIPSEIKSLRTNLMPFSFNEKIGELISSL